MLRFGRYETMERIASGGMATVYLGRAVGEGGFERLVAIKVMHEHIAAEPEFRDMFLDEARLAARIRHPNVVGVIDIQKAPEGLLLVMDYIDGPSLFQLRKKLSERNEILPVDVTLRVFVDALSGLHAAHELVGADGAPLNLVHRDVSPQNILVGKDGITRITDFGVARAEARITSTRGGQLKGKLGYMPPEQMKNEELDRRGDVYATGVALWEALTGRRLFEAGSDAALVTMIIGGAKTSPHDIDPSVPKPISDACMLALSRRVERRPATAADFADMLEEAAKTSGTSVASARRVAAFLAKLPRSVSHRPPPTPLATPPIAAPASAGDAIATVAHGSGQVRAEAATSGQPSGSAPATRAPESTTTRGMVVDDVPVRRSRFTRIAALSAGTAVLVALVGFGLTRTSEPAPAAPVVEHATASSTDTAAAAKPAAPAPTDSSAIAPGGASNATKAEPTAVAASSAAPIVSAGTEPPAKAKPIATAAGKPGRRAGPGYVPGEL